jgi:hypothetical protein
LRVIFIGSFKLTIGDLIRRRRRGPQNWNSSHLIPLKANPTFSDQSNRFGELFGPRHRRTIFHFLPNISPDTVIINSQYDGYIMSTMMMRGRKNVTGRSSRRDLLGPRKCIALGHFDSFSVRWSRSSVFDRNIERSG